MAAELSLQLFDHKLGCRDLSKGAIREEGTESDQVLRDRFSWLLGPGDEVESGLEDRWRRPEMLLDHRLQPLVCCRVRWVIVLGEVWSGQEAA